MMKQLLYRDIEKALEDLNAKDKGKYFLCECPECRHQEAFMYKNNLNLIQCNRENQCGERMILRFEEKKNIPAEWTIKEETYQPLKENQQQKLMELTRFLKHFQHAINSPRLENYRGLSRASTEPFLLDLYHEKFVRRMFQLGTDLLENDYRDSSFMLKRDFVFPLYGEDGQVDRILLRSSDTTLEPKEIQLIVNSSKKTRDFFVDLKEDSSFIVITEAVIDGASFREIDSGVSLMALTGSRKTNGICEYIESHHEKFKGKTFLMALDNDLAGRKAAERIIQSIQKVNLSYESFSFPNKIKDGNEWLNQNREEFERAYTELTTDILFHKKVDKGMTMLGEVSLMYQDMNIHPVRFTENIEGKVELQLPKGVSWVDEKQEQQVIAQFLFKKPEDGRIVLEQESPELIYNHETELLKYGGIEIEHVEVDRLPDGSQPLLFFPSEHSRIRNIKVSKDLKHAILQQDTEQFSKCRPMARKEAILER